ncbi:aldehyde dehydrogenase family protein [Haloactinomyces albus]|uniref:Aldehyde dehydrogenase (NAD+) n=1 Tax=Haloactinomyces albus TaxID=1352928 RepID=A0AAE4CP84_9ACTN|nr:aldehyde dehydrogenase family protein [Haloactinomyces albus]MDR7304166.1 aldehyde dehydrogenase (NAD+) [Haloactinomyces albus]
MESVVEYWIAGRAATSTATFEVRNPYDSSMVATACYATADDVEQAVAAADACRKDMAALPAHARAAALDHVSRRLAERGEEIAELIVAENGKPITWARAEVNRSVSTFRWAAEEARRFSGELQRLDTEPGPSRLALLRRAPRGPVLGIAPFNFPLNLVAHKVAPALAAGAPIVLKPAPKTPLSALLLGELLAETDLPAGAWSVLPTTDEQAADLVADPRLPVVSFTGSGPVGWRILDSVPRKHVTLELGGDAAVVVCPDYADEADLEHAAQRIATFAMYQAGQSCVSVQRVYAHREVYDQLAARVVKAVESLGTGDPRDESTMVGPLIEPGAADRVEEWVHEAIAAGAELLTGGDRDGNSCAPTVLAGVPQQARISHEEVFGPVVLLEEVEETQQAFDRVNESRYGLQAGVFTHDLQTAFHASATLDVGGVIVGDVPSYRADQMPYGGVKESGVGREGVRSAMHDLTEERVTVLTGIEM